MRKPNIFLFTVALCMALFVFFGSTAVSADEVEHLSILARGADFNGTVSLCFGPSGQLIVSDAFSNRLLKMDPRNGKVLEVYTEGVEGVADLTFHPDGTLYWVNPFAAQVYKKTADGVVTKIAQLTGMIDGVAVRDDHRVFTATFDGRNQVIEIDPNGVLPPKVVANVGGLDAFDFGPDGCLYAPDFLYGSGNIYKINVDTGAIDVIATGFGQPISTRFNSKGELHVLDTRTSEFVKVDIATGAKTVVGVSTPNSDNFDFSPRDEIYVANNADSYVAKVLSNGKLHYITKPGLSSPGGIWFRREASGKETLFVGDGFALRRYDARSGVLKESSYTDMGNPFAAVPPTALMPDGKNLILTNSLFNMLQVWDPDAGSTIEMYFDFAVPMNAVRFQGELVVAQLVTGDVVWAGDRTPLISGLFVPAGLLTDGQNLWVGDWATGIIRQIAENGQVLAQPKILVTGLDKPEGMTFDPDGSILVVETGKKRLLRIDPASGAVGVVVDNLAVGLVAPAGTPPTWVALSGVTVDPEGDIYLTGDIDNVIYKLWRSGKN